MTHYNDKDLQAAVSTIARRGEVRGLSEAALIVRDCAAQGLGLAAAERAIAARAAEIEAEA